MTTKLFLNEAQGQKMENKVEEKINLNDDPSILLKRFFLALPPQIFASSNKIQEINFQGLYQATFSTSLVATITLVHLIPYSQLSNAKSVSCSKGKLHNHLP